MIYGNNILNNTTILNEIKVIEDRDEGISIYVDGDGDTFYGFAYDPYFKIYNSIDRSKATKSTRIGIIGGAHYIIHNNEIWILNSSYRQALIKIMSKPIKNLSNKSITVWDKIIDSMIILSKDKVNDSSVIYRIKNTPMPDFMDIAPAKNKK